MALRWCTIALVMALAVMVSGGEPAEVACSSIVYCNNDVLRAVQLAGIFNDSKTFVDMPMRQSPEVVLSAFEALGASPSKAALEAFVREYFEPPGSDLEAWLPPDWQPEPPLLARIADASLRSWALALNQIWKQLGRKVSARVAAAPSRFSLLPVRHAFIVPGGRFREFYYWDAHWIINGLLLCEMHDTARGMIDNMLDLVMELGFVPNGGRVYYTRRSQPPFLTQMVASYLEYETARRVPLDYAFLQRAVTALEREHRFWLESRSVNISSQSSASSFSLARFRADSNVPRPEGFAEDVATAKLAGVDPSTPNQVYRDIASGAETGWDFSTRWFRDYATIESICTSDIVPVDLNALLYKNERDIQGFYTLLSKYAAAFNSTLALEYEHKASEFASYASDRQRAIQAIMWNEAAGTWLDYDLSSGTPRSAKHWFASVLSPVWAQVVDTRSNTSLAALVLSSLRASGALEYVGGLPTSLVDSGQQWDLPNGWAPLQEIAVAALEQLNTSGGTSEARSLANKWIQNNYNGFAAEGLMFEKYNVSSLTGLPGGGGEYEVQAGFGWSNGVVLQFLVANTTHHRRHESARRHHSNLIHRVP